MTFLFLFSFIDEIHDHKKKKPYRFMRFVSIVNEDLRDSESVVEAYQPSLRCDQAPSA